MRNLKNYMKPRLVMNLDICFLDSHFLALLWQNKTDNDVSEISFQLQVFITL